jgi:hypothetical protein
VTSRAERRAEAVKVRTEDMQERVRRDRPPVSCEGWDDRPELSMRVATSPAAADLS